VQSVDDLNAVADLMATLYDEVALLNSESLDGSNVVAGGAAQALSYSAAGVAGPSGRDTPALDGIAWSAVVPFTLTEVATFVGFLRGGVVQLTERLPNPVGPGSVPYVHGIGPLALTTD